MARASSGSSGSAHRAMSDDDAAIVTVSVRIKPSDNPAVFATTNGVLVQRPREGSVVHDGFASIIEGDCDQAAAFDAIAAPLLERLHQGYSCTLIAYGQTGSGKTHTIFGPPGALTEKSVEHFSRSVATIEGDAPDDWGLFPRIALALLAAGTGALHASAVEVYQEKAFDLLADRIQLTVGTQKAGRKTDGPGAKSKGNDAVHLSTCKCRECYIQKENEAKVRKACLDAGKAPPKPGKRAAAPAAATPASADESETSFATIGERRVLLSSALDVARLARTIELTRTAVGHLLNERSSRSHCLVHLHLTEQTGGGGRAGAVSVSKRQLLFADLAGSERILKTGAEGVAAKQAVAINTSLSALGKCTRALAVHAAYVPYRESTLTQLLRSSLSGKASLAAVITVAGDAAHVDESKCSLEYGMQMGALRTRATVVQSSTIAGEVKAINLQLSKARPALAEMEANGYAEKFGKAAEPTAIKTFNENTRHLLALEAAIREEKAAMAELGARGEGRSAQAAETALSLREASAEWADLSELIGRQKSIPGFYIPARAVYTIKLAEIRALEGRLQQLHAAASAPSAALPPDSTAQAERIAGQLRTHFGLAPSAKRSGAGASGADEKSHLDEEWSTHLHPETGVTYYFNAISGESTYDAPPVSLV